MGPIDFDDVGRIVQGIAAATDPAFDGSAQERRVAIVRSLSQMISADVWFWVTGEINPHRRGDAMVTSTLDEGFRNETERAEFFRIVSHPDLAPVVQGPLYDAIVSQRRITRTRNGLVSDGDWNASPVSGIWRAAGFDDFIMAIYPLSASSHSAVGYHRRLGRPRFTSREEAVVHAVFQHIQWLHPTAISPAGRTAITLSPRERQVIMLLMDGNPRKQIAASMGISPHTVTDYLKEIYRKFGVRSRAELLSKFIRSEAEL